MKFFFRSKVTLQTIDSYFHKRKTIKKIILYVRHVLTDVWPKFQPTCPAPLLFDHENDEDYIP